MRQCAGFIYLLYMKSTNLIVLFCFLICPVTSTSQDRGQEQRDYKEIAEPYVSAGSLYLSTAVFLVLDLPEQTPLWAAPAADWKQKKI